MTEEAAKRPGVERLPNHHVTSVTDELNKILSMLKDISPDEATISFDFDGRLHVHIDVHNVEDLLRIEALLPTLGAGIFHDLTRGETPHRPFFHRLSAIVDR